MTTSHPNDYHSDLTEDRLNIIARKMLKMVYLTYDTNSTDYDGRWTLGSVIFGRIKKMLELMALESEYPWFGLAKSGMDITPTIGSVPFRFATDDPNAPKKAHILDQNPAELCQMGFAFSDEQDLKWRWYIEKGYSEFDTPKVTFVGLDCLSNDLVCEWAYSGDIPSIHAVDSERKSSVIQSEPAVQLPAAGVTIKKSQNSD